MSPPGIHLLLVEKDVEQLRWKNGWVLDNVFQVAVFALEIRLLLKYS